MLVGLSASSRDEGVDSRDVGALPFRVNLSLLVFLISA